MAISNISMLTTSEVLWTDVELLNLSKGLSEGVASWEDSGVL